MDADDDGDDDDGCGGSDGADERDEDVDWRELRVNPTTSRFCEGDLKHGWLNRFSKWLLTFLRGNPTA